MTVTQTDLHRLLAACGIRPDDKVTMHTSLRAVGSIEGGADGLIDAFCTYLCDGLFLVPTHTWANVNKDSPVYDVRSTKPCIGTLPTVAAFRPDGVRSLHPTHSLTAFGKDAAAYVAGEEMAETPAPMWGALSRLYEERGKILLVGVGLERNTYMHAVEERLDVPDRLNPETFTATILDHDGHTLASKPYHSHHATVGDVSLYYPNYKEAFEHTGALTYHRLGGATVYCLDAVRLTDAMRTIYERSEGQDLCLVHAPIPAEYYQ